jgi:hypothetical protein
VAFECRTTCDPNYLDPSDILKIATELHQMGVKTYALQKYHTFPEDKNPPSISAIESFFEKDSLTEIKKLYPNLIIR